MDETSVHLRELYSMRPICKMGLTQPVILSVIGKNDSNPCKSCLALVDDWNRADEEPDPEKSETLSTLLLVAVFLALALSVAVSLLVGLL